MITSHLDKYICNEELGIQELKLMFQVLYALISRLMSNDLSNNSIIEDYIKVFLSFCFVISMMNRYDNESVGHYYNKHTDSKLYKPYEEVCSVIINCEALAGLIINHKPDNLYHLTPTCPFFTY